MFSGIAAGLFSALFMSLSYIFSRIYLRKYPDPVKLTIHTLFVMGTWGMVLLGISAFFLKFPWNTKFFLLLAGEILFYVIGQSSFFMLLKNLEASRASSLLGLKVITLALLSLCFGKHLSALQASAIILCTIAAVGMNFSGGKLSVRSILWLACSTFFYSACDICIAEMMHMMPKDHSTILNALGVMGVCYAAMGLCTLPCLLKYPLQKQTFRETVSYSFFYFSSILCLMACFGAVGVVFGNILQAGRGLISVALGVILLKLGWEKNEPLVSKRIWIRRFIMAILMLSAMALYSWASSRG